MAGLKRIILIDTHLPGVVELKLDGHTNICGTNASGKTTLQRLIPVFYGEYPSRVVPSTRDSFERWYLPRQSSFIIYEYARGDEALYQAVLSSNGNGVNYRFVGKPFSLEDYLYQNKKGEHSSLSMTEVSRNLKRANVIVSNLLNTKEFRAVLQNDRGVINAAGNSRELLGYANLFSLCDTSHSLRHVEKLAKAVHSKEGKMETIKAMIAAILEEDGVQPPSSNISAARVEDWIRECHLIRDFDAIRPEFAKLEQADLALSRNEVRLGALKAQFKVDSDKVAADILTAQGNFDKAQLDLKQLEAGWTATRDELNQDLSVAKADAAKFEADLEQVEREFEQWQEQDIETLQQNVQNLAAWKSELETLNARYQLLTEKHQDIEATFNKRLVDIAEKLSAEVEAFGEQKQQLQEDIAEKKSEQHQRLMELHQDYQQQLNKVESEAGQTLNQLKVEEAQLSSDLKNTGFNEFEQGQLDILEASIKEAVLAEDSGRDALKSADNALHQVQQHRDKASDTLEQVRRHYQSKQSAVSAVEALLYPGEGTLLEFLRRQAPNWESNLGKVLHPDLLSRTDLSPAKAKGDSLYGVNLDLDTLALPPYSEDEASLQAKLVEAQQQLAEALEAQNDAEQSLAEANENVRNQELSRATQESQCRTLEANRKRAQQDKEQLQREYQQHVAERKQSAKKKLSDNQTQQKKVNAQLDAALEEVKDQMREAETEHQFHWQQLIGDIEQQLRQVEQHLSQARQNAEQDKAQTQAWLQNELNDRGVDVDEIGELQKRINTLGDDIKVTEANRHKVKDYERWYELVFNGHKVTWQQSLSKAKKVVSEAQRQLQSQESEYQQQRKSTKEQQQQSEQWLSQSKEQQQEILSLSRLLAKVTLPSAEFDADTTTVGQRLSEGQSLLQERETLLDDIKAYVEHFDQLIASQAGTGLSDTWEKAREDCMQTNAQGVRSIDHRKMVGHLSRLLNDIVPQKLQGLREQGRIFGADLTAYYRVLEDIDRRILSQSKRITQEVEDELYLDGVSDSAVRIRSRISELEFWPELKQFHQLHKAWMEGGAEELPNSEYGQSMRRVIDILGKSALGGGIHRLLDIELHLKEGNSQLVIRTDRQLNESSSHGMAYLILCKFLLAFTRLLRGEADAVMHWPIDELGTLHQSNIKKIFDACQNNNISVVGAFPNPESEVLTLFDNRYLIDKATRRLQVVQPKVSLISERLKARQAQQSEVEVEEAGA